MRLTAIDWRSLTDVATLQQRFAHAPTALWAVAALLPPLAAGGLLLAARQAEQMADAQRQAGQAALVELRRRAGDISPADPSPFAARLPLTQSSARVITHLREAAEGQSVLVTAISTTQNAATANTLGRMSLDVNLRGTYSAIKTVIAEVLTRDAQQAVLQQLSMRRAAGAAPTSSGFGNATSMYAAGPPSTAGVRPMAASVELEARVVATWLSRPLLDDASITAPRTAVAASREVSASSASASAASEALAASGPIRGPSAVQPPAPSASQPLVRR